MSYHLSLRLSGSLRQVLLCRSNCFAREVHKILCEIWSTLMTKTRHCQNTPPLTEFSGLANDGWDYIFIVMLGVINELNTKYDYSKTLYFFISYRVSFTFHWVCYLVVYLHFEPFQSGVIGYLWSVPCCFGVWGVRVYSVLIPYNPIALCINTSDSNTLQILILWLTLLCNIAYHCWQVVVCSCLSLAIGTP